MSAQRPELGNRSGVQPVVDSEHVARTIDEIERGLVADDPDLVRRVRRATRPRHAHVALVVLLLVASALLLAHGVARTAWSTFLAGAAALVVASVVDHRARHRQGRTHRRR